MFQTLLTELCQLPCYIVTSVTRIGITITQHQHKYGSRSFLSLFDANGSSVIVHLNEDRGTAGVSGEIRRPTDRLWRYGRIHWAAFGALLA